MKKRKENKEQINQRSFLQGREYERLYQLGKQKKRASKIVIKWFSGLPLEKNQQLADDVSQLLSLLTQPNNPK